jgi:RNA polymerase sigma-70 factor (ECF subfamily)
MDTVQGPYRTPEEEITRMVESYQSSLLRLCCAYLRDRAAAEDAVQETFLKAYKNISTLRQAASEKAWLTRIAVNVCRDQKKSAWFRYVARSVSLDQLPEPVGEPPTEQDRELTLTVLRLPDKLREAVLLYYYQDLSTVEIAQALQISQQAVSARLARARERLRAALEKGEGK